MSIQPTEPRVRDSRPRIFLSCSYKDDTRNIVDAFNETAEKAGFHVVHATTPSSDPPHEHVRKAILSCDCFAALLTPQENSPMASAWVYNEIGMAYVLNLPLLICKENTITDTGLVEFATIYQTFDKSNLLDFRRALEGYLSSVKNDRRLTNMQSLGNFLSHLAREAVYGYGDEAGQTSLSLDRLAKIVTPLVSEIGKLSFSFGEPDIFFERRGDRHSEKRAIARYVFDKHLASRSEHDEHLVFIDSGTVAYTLSEEIVARNRRIPVMTNNVASCRVFSAISAYPAFVVPGEFDSHYVAALGDECISYVNSKLAAESGPKRIELAFVAATSLNSYTGICGNDQRHNELKRLLMGGCPRCVVICEGEKLLGTVGSPIFSSAQSWREFAQTRRGKVEFVTHEPEEFQKLTAQRRSQFESEVMKLKQLFGDEAVTVLREDDVGATLM